jgi:hypothetical protein
MPKRSSKPAQDVNTLAKAVVEQATAESSEAETDECEGKNPAAVALGRLGGLKGGKARAAQLTQKQRTAIAKKAARVRWAGIKRKGQ